MYKFYIELGLEVKIEVGFGLSRGSQVYRVQWFKRLKECRQI